MSPLPDWMAMRRQTVRANVNPLDKSTVFSIYPKKIVETKHTITPGSFTIEAGSYENPARLLVEPSSWWKELEEGQPLLEISVSSVIVANSVCQDYMVGLLCCDMGECRPGVFFIPGDISVKDLKDKYKSQLEQAMTRQKNWFTALVNEADVWWARTNGNPLSVSDDSRIAAKELNMLDKEWLKNSQTVELKRCIACGTLNNSKVIVCPTCKVITNPEEFKKLNLQFASQ